MYFLYFGCLLAFAVAQPSPSAVPGTSASAVPGSSSAAVPGPTNASPSLSPNPTGGSPTTTFAGSQFRTTSGGNVPIAKVAATEHTLSVEKPTTAPLSTKPDTWTSVGFTGSGQRWQPQTGQVNLPELPYDPTQSKMTIGQQILQQQQLQQQQQQQAPVEYDMFGFPINNAAGVLTKNDMLRPTVVDVTHVMSLFPHIKRRSRRAPLYHGNIAAPPHGHRDHKHPPKPPVHDTVSPGRRRPPPPPPLYDDPRPQRRRYKPRGSDMLVPQYQDHTEKPKQARPQVKNARNYRQPAPRVLNKPRYSQPKPSAFAGEFSEALSGEQFVSNPRNQLLPPRGTKKLPPRFATQLSSFPKVDAPRVFEPLTARPAPIEPEPPLAQGPSETVHQTAVVEAPIAYPNEQVPNTQQNIIMEHGESAKEYINTEPIFDTGSQPVDGMGSNVPGHAHEAPANVHDSLSHEITPVHPHETVPAHPNENAPLLPLENAPVHPQENASLLPHENLPPHPNDNTVAPHPHENTPQQPHETAPAQPHEHAPPLPNDNTAAPQPHVTAPAYPIENASPHPIDYTVPPTPADTLPPQPNTPVYASEQVPQGNGPIGKQPAKSGQQNRNRGQRKRPGRRWQRPGKRNGGRKMARPAPKRPSPPSVPSAIAGDLNQQLEGHFMTLFDTWYKDKFQQTTRAPPGARLPSGVLTGPPVVLRPVRPNPKAVIKGTDLRAQILRPNGRQTQKKVQHVPNSNNKQTGLKQKPDPLNKAALFDEFMLMFKTQMKETVQPTAQHTPVVALTTAKTPLATQPKTTVSQAPSVTNGTSAATPAPKKAPATTVNTVNTTAAPGIPELIPTILPPDLINRKIHRAAVITRKAPRPGGITRKIPKVSKAPVVTVRLTKAPTTPVPATTTIVVPTIDPELLADVNEARAYQSLPPLLPYQVDHQGQVKPRYRHLANGGRLPGANMNLFAGMNSNLMNGMNMMNVPSQNLNVQHDAFHREAGLFMNPVLHRRIHMLLRQNGHNQRRNLFGIVPNRIVPTHAPMDPDVMADLMEAAQARGVGAFGR